MKKEFKKGDKVRIVCRGSVANGLEGVVVQTKYNPKNFVNSVKILTKDQIVGEFDMCWIDTVEKSFLEKR